MRKMKCILSVMVVLLVVLSGMTVAHADTMYTVDGYTYSLNNRGLAVLVGWDNSSDTLYVPYNIGNVLVAEIGNSAFKDDDFIKHLDLHDARRMYHIGEFAFANSVLEGELIVTTQVTYVGAAAFENCDRITSVKYSSDGGTVPAQCFNGCDALENVVLSDSITTIRQYAFANCSALTGVKIPKKTTEIDLTAFQNSPNVVIFCYYGSYAAQFAEENGIEYVILDPENIPYTYLRGDADGDGDVTIFDATRIQRILADLVADEDGMMSLRGDILGDGLDILDATRVQRFLADLDDGYGIGEEVSVIL